MKKFYLRVLLSCAIDLFSSLILAAPPTTGTTTVKWHCTSANCGFPKFTNTWPTGAYSSDFYITNFSFSNGSGKPLPVINEITIRVNTLGLTLVQTFANGDYVLRNIYNKYYLQFNDLYTTTWDIYVGCADNSCDSSTLTGDVEVAVDWKKDPSTPGQPDPPDPDPVTNLIVRSLICGADASWVPITDENVESVVVESQRLASDRMSFVTFERQEVSPARSAVRVSGPSYCDSLFSFRVTTRGATGKTSSPTSTAARGMGPSINKLLFD